LPRFRLNFNKFGVALPEQKEKIRIEDKRKIDAVTKKVLRPTQRHSRDVDKEFIQEIITKSLDAGLDPYTSLAQAMQESGFDNDFTFMVNDLPSYLVKEKQKLTQPIINLYTPILKKFTKDKKLQENTMNAVVSEYLNNNYEEDSGRQSIFYNLIGINDAESMDNRKKVLQYVKQNREKLTDINDKIIKFETNSPIDKYIEFFKDKMAYADRLGVKDEARRLQLYQGNGKVKNQYGLNGITDLSKYPAYGIRVQDIRENIIKKNEIINKMINDYNSKKKQKDKFGYNTLDSYDNVNDAFKAIINAKS